MMFQDIRLFGKYCHDCKMPVSRGLPCIIIFVNSEPSMANKSAKCENSVIHYIVE